MTTENTTTILTEELTRLKDDITEAHIRSGKKVTGRTIGTLQTRVSANRGQLLGADYLFTLDMGRQGGRIPHNFKGIIAAWAANKGLTFANEKDAMRFAYFVAKKIAREGTALNRAGGRTDVIRDNVAAFEERLNKRISAMYKTEITNEIFNYMPKGNWVKNN